MKDTFYFAHDYNSRSDVKIKKLIRSHGLLGYGIFWVLIEDLYNNANALPLDYDGIAYELRYDVELVKSIINDFDLFIIDGDTFGSLSIENRLEARNEKSKKARESASKRWAKSEDDANAMRTHSDSNAKKERKEKEIKERKEKETICDAFYSFEELIELYPKVNSHKVETISLFNNLSSTDKEKCITFAKQLQQIWKQNGNKEKYTYMKSCHTFVEQKLFNGKPSEVLPAGISTEVVEQPTQEQIDWVEANKEKYMTPIEKFRLKQEQL